MFSALLAIALAMPEPESEAAPEAEAAPDADADAAAHYYGYYGWPYRYRYAYYGYPYYYGYGHYGHWWGKRSAEEPDGETRRFRRSADAAPGPDASPDAEADPASLYLGYYGAYPTKLHYGVAGYPYYYGHHGLWYGKRSAEEPGDARRYRRSADPATAPQYYRRPEYDLQRQGRSADESGPAPGPDAAPEADADAAAWYYSYYTGHHGYYGYGLGHLGYYGYGYPYYGYYWG